MDSVDAADMAISGPGLYGPAQLCDRTLFQHFTSILATTFLYGIVYGKRFRLRRWPHLELC